MGHLIETNVFCLDITVGSSSPEVPAEMCHVLTDSVLEGVLEGDVRALSSVVSYTALSKERASLG